MMEFGPKIDLGKPNQTKQNATVTAMKSSTWIKKKKKIHIIIEWRSYFEIACVLKI